MNFFSFTLGKILNFLNTLFVLIFQFLNNKNFIKYFLYLKKINSLTKKNINNKYKNQKLNINQIKKIKKTNEVFIYGSGYSIN